LTSLCRQEDFFFFWLTKTQYTSPTTSRLRDVTPTISPMGRPMPTLIPPTGGLELSENVREVLRAGLGSNVVSTGWDLVDTVWGV
jgi:hypothetical protein